MRTVAFNVFMLRVDDASEVLKILDRAMEQPDYLRLMMTSSDPTPGGVNCRFTVLARTPEVLEGFARAALLQEHPDAEARVRIER